MSLSEKKNNFEKLLSNLKTIIVRDSPLLGKYAEQESTIY